MSVPTRASARQIVIKSIYQAAQVKDNPADLINVAIAELINQRYELPAFSTLDRIIRRIRTLVNGVFFDTVGECATNNSTWVLPIARV